MTHDTSPQDETPKTSREEMVEWVNQFSPRIYRLALRMVNDPQDAEDVLQETFLKALKAYSSFEHRSSPLTWLYRIAVNEALMLMRRRHPQTSLDAGYGDDEDDPEPEGMEIKDWCCLPEAEIVKSETRRYLDGAVQKLPDTLRTVFVLRDGEGLSIQETAEALQISEANVKTRLLRARLRLREDMTRFFSASTQEAKE
jgi:RNA polymerase sigma-70 factor (ECF subfamily)